MKISIFRAESDFDFGLNIGLSIAEGTPWSVVWSMILAATGTRDSDWEYLEGKSLALKGEGAVRLGGAWVTLG